MKLTNHLIIALAAVALITTMGCSKFRDNRQYDTTLESGIAESSFFDMFRMVEQVSGASAGLVSEPCLTVTGFTGAYPATITYDFGTEICADIYGIKRSGSFTAVYSDAWANTGATITITPNSYSTTGYTLAGTLKLTNLGVNSDGKREIAYEVTGGLVNVTDVVSFTWECNRTMTLTNVNNADLIHDDVYSITGTASGVNTDGRSFSVEITTPLVKEVICRWNRAGVVKIAIQDLKDREVNYGTDYCFDNADCCDNYADISIDGKKDKTIRMR